MCPRQHDLERWRRATPEERVLEGLRLTVIAMAERDARLRALYPDVCEEELRLIRIREVFGLPKDAMPPWPHPLPDPRPYDEQGLRRSP